MNRYYAVGLQRNGSVGLWKRTGENDLDLLDSATAKGVKPGDWHRVQVQVKDGFITVSLDGTHILKSTDPDPLSGGRLGFEAPLHLADAQVRACSFFLEPDGSMSG